MGVRRGTGIEVGELGGDGLAQDQRARFLKAGDAAGFGAGERLGRDRRAGARVEAIDVEDVLDADQDPEEWWAGADLREVLFERGGLAEEALTAIGLRQDGTQLRVRGLDAVDCRTRPVKAVERFRDAIIIDFGAEKNLSSSASCLWILQQGNCCT